MKRSIGRLALGLLLLGGLIQPAFAEDAIGLESWRGRAQEGNFAQEIAGVYLIRHHTDDGRPGSFRLVSLTAGGNWASTNSNQHAIVNLTGFQILEGFEEVFEEGMDAFGFPGFLIPEVFEEGMDTSGVSPEGFFDPATLFNPSRFSDQHGVWARSGWREITAEVMDFNLDALTGVHTDIVRVRYVVQFSKDLQSVTGMQQGRVFPLDQDPLDPEAVPALEFGSTFSGRRVTVEAE